ncbi:hypothetical protein NP233_g6463 [Leucocoprinus birnbaumii]|uniref:Uncharacterized protein n=1 Tax=Leucocoprinus birnbaumii TaxID=56174 RepID=A0AAD5VTT4_9AGAR|nr:hypothetical protein NP233_g6463 [Leucocoprinus birnbaumii]
MWSGRFTPKGEVPPPPQNIGKTIVVGSAIVAAGLSGFYINMLRNKHKQEREGTNPTYEQVIAHVNTKPLKVEDVNSLPSLHHSLRSLPMLAPTKEHNAKHITIDDWKASGDHEAVERYQVPPPQRSRGDGSGRVYTKSPDYARNYEKTNNRIEKDQTGRMSRM